jgi:NADPH-dependent glutamate synthase beta subunit-like oxidoreductase
MEAARIAAMRGHAVTIFERGGELGGAILCCCVVPGKNKMKWYADWLRLQMKKLEVEVRFRASPGPEELREFDAVIVATGGRIARPPIPGIGSPRVVTFQDVLRCHMTKCEFHPGDKEPPVECGASVLIWGDHFGAADAAEKLAGQGKEVTVVTENREFASWMEPCHRDVMLKRFRQGNGEGLAGKPFPHPVRVIQGSTVMSIGEDGEVTLMDAAFAKSVLRADNVVLASVEPEDGLYGRLLEAGIRAALIGDARRVRNLRAAVNEGANIGLTIDEDLGTNANRALVSNLPTEVK